MNTYEKLQSYLKAVREKTDFVPDLAIVLGSGLNYFADNIDTEAIVPYSEIEGFPVSTVSGHDGQFVFGRLNGKNVVVMRGRVHYYEGYSMEDVVAPVRLMGLMGAKTLFLTNAAGGINESFIPGDLMVLTGHISSFVPSPLVGPNIDQLGLRFPDMSKIYSPRLRQAIYTAAESCDIALKEGVYVQTTGPQYETPEEIKMYRLLGADAVGMSTACEAVAARHMGMEICAVSCISNMAAGILDQPLTHEEVKKTADEVSDKFTRLLIASVGLI